MTIQAKYYDFIKNGTKRIELRLFDEKRQAINIGDLIEFRNGNETFRARVSGLLRYDTFESLVNDFDIAMLADQSMTKIELLVDLNKFYPSEKQKTLGVIGICIELEK